MKYFSIYFTTIILDFMAYSSHIISKIYLIDSLIGSIEQARIIVVKYMEKYFIFSSNNNVNFICDDI